MSRYTEKNAKECGKSLADMLGKKFNDCYDKDTKKAIVGCWSLDCNPVYGGCIIEEMYNEGGAVTKPFGSERLSPRDFCTAIRYAKQAVYMYKKSRGD